MGTPYQIAESKLNLINIISKEAKDFIRKMLQHDPSIQIIHINVKIKDIVPNKLLMMHGQRHIQESSHNNKIIVNQLSTKEEKSELLKTFQCLDTNQDEKLSKEELLRGLSDEVDRIFQQVDKNNSGSIDYTEFVIAIINRQQLLSKQRLQVTFCMFDKVQDKIIYVNNGSISIDELKNMFSGIQEENSDGQISIEENSSER